MTTVEDEKQQKKNLKQPTFWLALLAGLLFFLVIYFRSNIFPNKSSTELPVEVKSVILTPTPTPRPTLDISAYDAKILLNANNPKTATTTTSTKPTLPVTRSLGEGGWPVKTVYPNADALLPFNRIVAYYGNLYSKNMGVLGQYPENVMLDKLNQEVLKWQQADPSTPVIPALHYIAEVAQAGGGADGKYRSRMPDSEIDKVIEMAKKDNALVFLDIQVGLSNVKDELPTFDKYLKMDNVHLGIDPEFYMKDGAHPGREIGTMDADDINYTANYLAKIVRDNNQTTKILVIHRFTKPMVTSYKNITPLPEVQIVMDMDGFGSQASKKSTYYEYIYKEPVQFTGFKLFYKNDIVNSSILTPKDLLKLTLICRGRKS